MILAKNSKILWKSIHKSTYSLYSAMWPISMNDSTYYFLIFNFIVVDLLNRYAEVVLSAVGVSS